MKYFHANVSALAALACLLTFWLAPLRADATGHVSSLRKIENKECPNALINRLHMDADGFLWV